MYLYFHERILGSLIGDPTFALVYWNWDDQRDGGNVLPPMFLKPDSGLFDANRSASALNGSVLVRLSPASRTQNNTLVASENLNAMYQVIDIYIFIYLSIYLYLGAIMWKPSSSCK
jgi:polyphenol oxidase